MTTLAPRHARRSRRTLRPGRAGDDNISGVDAGALVRTGVGASAWSHESSFHHSAEGRHGRPRESIAADMRLDHVGVNVADLTAAEAWYTKAFSLHRELEVRIAAVDLDIVMLKSKEFGHRVELLHRPGSRPGLRAANPAVAALTEGFGHIAFDVPDLDAAHRRLVSISRAARSCRPSRRPSPGSGCIRSRPRGQPDRAGGAAPRLTPSADAADAADVADAAGKVSRSGPEQETHRALDDLTGRVIVKFREHVRRARHHLDSRAGPRRGEPSASRWLCRSGASVSAPPCRKRKAGPPGARNAAGSPPRPDRDAPSAPRR